MLSVALEALIGALAPDPQGKFRGKLRYFVWLCDSKPPISLVFKQQVAVQAD